MERTFIERLSPQSRRFRFLETFQSPGESLLHQLTVINPLNEVAYVAVIDDGPQDKEVGVGRFSATPGTHECEFAIVVADAWQHKGLGTLLMHHLVQAARALGLERMHSSDPSDNALMREFAAHLHFHHSPDPLNPTQILYRLDISASLENARVPVRGLEC